ncbi:MBOAT family O-acyltransferase, partial [Treponema sp. JC4]|uniref:MBOAT family O-acyltransferase n=1 Tax=Treponema sp. JC4 TaxID=1124982 RepID=UPI000587B6F5
VPQFENPDNQIISWNNIAKGMFIFSIGVTKKILLADPLTVNAQSFFNIVGSLTSATNAWWYSVEYTIAYYFDLSSYADMAIGIGLMFNIIIPENFNSPYKAKNFQEYWQRWHITLSRFLGAYVFRSIYKKEALFRNYYVATIITFLVSGFWHGAGWTFVVWGLVNGSFVCIASWMKQKKYSFPNIIAHTLTIIGIILTRILFV